MSEFGFAEPFEGQKQILGDITYDLARATYYHDYMQAILIAISEGVNVVSCIAWSIMDNLEWNQGYTSKFGMQVNFGPFFAVTPTTIADPGNSTSILRRKRGTTKQVSSNT